MLVVLRWYYNERDVAPSEVVKEFAGVFGPFSDAEAARSWISTQPDWGGWGKYEYQAEALENP